eukprot:Gb_20511 [translate_table: standard]
MSDFTDRTTTCFTSTQTHTDHGLNKKFLYTIYTHIRHNFIKIATIQNSLRSKSLFGSVKAHRLSLSLFSDQRTNSLSRTNRNR